MPYSKYPSGLTIGSEINEKLRKLTAVICKLTDKISALHDVSTQEGKFVCISNDGGTTKLIGYYVVNKQIPNEYTLYFEGEDVTGSYSVVPCEDTSSYDYKEEIVCVDGLNWSKIRVFDTENSSVPTLISTLWFDENNNPVSTPDVSLIENANCQDAIVCSPTVSDAFSDDLSTLLEGTSFVITKPDCCRVLITTSVGSFTLREKETYYSTTDFDCPITIDSVQIISGNCTLEEIHIISNKSK